MLLTRHPMFRPYLALASVCFFWGTTYLAIRIAVETFPPLLPRRSALHNFRDHHAGRRQAGGASPAIT